MILLDSDVLVDHLRGLPAARQFLERSSETLAISVVTLAELYAGARTSEEEAEIEKVASVLHVFEIDRGIAQEAGRLRKRYFRSHGLELPDALIAATAAVHRAKLATLNARHYPMFKSVLVPYRRA